MAKRNYDYEIYTGCNCIPNSGDTGGYGVLILQDGEEIARKSGGYIGTTSKRMEIMAAIVGLETVAKPSRILLYTNSQYVVRSMQGVYRKTKNCDLWERLEHAADRHREVLAEWVQGHAGNRYNEICDELAAAGRQGAYVTDNGYSGIVRESQPLAMAVRFPDDSIAELTNDNIPDGYLNASCLSAIKKFKREYEHRFKSYTALATGGMDGFSYFKGETLLDAVDNADITDFFFDVFPPKYAESACRWYLRGLTVKEAFEKTRADIKVSQNAIEAKKMKKG